jgi:hypothetical protein
MDHKNEKSLPHMDEGKAVIFNIIFMLL